MKIFFLVSATQKEKFYSKEKSIKKKNVKLSAFKIIADGNANKKKRQRKIN